MFSNGLDEEFALFNEWENKIFNNGNHSFAFIFSKSQTIKKEQSQFLIQFREKLK